MCGIVCTFGNTIDVPTNLLSHRGPDDYKRVQFGSCMIDYYRLAINDLTENGMQPFITDKSIFACNGEIYNHKQFRTGKEKTTSDCIVVMDMIEKSGIKTTLKNINGDYAFVYSDGSRIIVARDPLGVRPLFYVRYDNESMAFASEAKALLFLNKKINIFPPGYFYDSLVGEFICHHNMYWSRSLDTRTYIEKEWIKNTLEDAVKLRLQTTDRPIGFLLSGGLDSSLIASIAQRQLGKIKTFSIGVQDSPDLVAARKVAEYLDSDHTEVIMTAEEGISALQDVIKSLESYDTTTVRASIPMYLLCKYIKENTPCRYIFSGEGSDEVLGGYLYFHYAPSEVEFSMENIRRLKLIHQFDGLRADRCAGAHGLDLVVPFLDKFFVECAMTIEQRLKLPSEGHPAIEKRVLREVFTEYLPEEVLWRQKDGMSDAVGKSWVESLNKFCDETISDMHFRMIQETSEHNKPLTKEEALYRVIFWEQFGRRNEHLISEIWRPKWIDITDPSANHIKSRLNSEK
jgi:asparagine synthase (glutamine-hydrolysing)